MKSVIILISACALGACSYFPAHTPGYAAPKPEPTPVISDATISELQYCLIVEQDVLDVFDKLNRKDRLITTAYSKFERIDLRMKQIHGQSKTNLAIAESYTNLEYQKKAQGDSVLALFRDRAAIHSRLVLLEEDRDSTCINKSFQPEALEAACNDLAASKSFRCKLRF